MPTNKRLSQTLFGATFHNPVLLAAGTCGFGEELEDALDLEALGGIVTKSVTLEPRAGNRVVVEGARKLTDRPLLVKLAPNVPDIGPVAEAAEDAGADGVTLVNTMPGLLIDIASRRAALGAGSGGLSGPALRAVGVHAVHRARACTSITLLGVGGITAAEDAIQYLLAGASLVQVGTATFADPRAAQRVVMGIARYTEKMGIENVQDLIGVVQGTDRPVPVSGGPR